MSRVISKVRSFKRLFKEEENVVFLFVISLLAPEIFKFSYYAIQSLMMSSVVQVQW